MTELIVEAGSEQIRLSGTKVGYVQAVAGDVTLSKDPRCAHRAGFLVRLLGGWYLYTEDPATADLEVNGLRVTGQATPLSHDHIRVTRSLRALGSRQDRRTLAGAVRTVCPTYRDLEQMLAAKCDVELRDLAEPGDLDELAARVVAAAERFLWLPDLASAVGWDGPDDPPGDEPAPGPVFDEAAVNDKNDFLHPDNFASKLETHIQQVCWIEVETTTRGPVRGTGFLVGADRVMTNYHVLADVLAGDADPEAVRFRFGYRVIGRRVDRGREARLAQHWNLASSPPSTGLDYAIVRLSEPVGRDPMIARPGTTRGWFPVPAGKPPPAAGERLLILQHPDNGPLKMAMEPDGIIAVDDTGGTMTHRVNTLKGSSGAPCLNFDFTLLGLHRSGFDATSNKAVSIAAIAGHLRAQGRHHLLDN